MEGSTIKGKQKKSDSLNFKSIIEAKIVCIEKYLTWSWNKVTKISISPHSKWEGGEAVENIL